MRKVWCKIHNTYNKIIFKFVLFMKFNFFKWASWTATQLVLILKFWFWIIIIFFPRVFGRLTKELNFFFYMRIKICNQKRTNVKINRLKIGVVHFHKVLNKRPWNMDECCFNFQQVFLKHIFNKPCTSSNTFLILFLYHKKNEQNKNEVWKRKALGKIYGRKTNRKIIILKYLMSQTYYI